MSKLFLPVPHRTEAFAGACLPACCEMALAYCGISEMQSTIASQIGYIDGAGTPAKNILRLAAFGVRVVLHKLGTIADLQKAVKRHIIPIVFLRTGELPYWDCDTPHAVVVVGVELENIYVNDPSFSYSPIPMMQGDFQLAWDEFGGQWGAIQCRV